MGSHCIARINHTHLLLTGGYDEAGAATATAHIYDIENERFGSVFQKLFISIWP